MPKKKQPFMCFVSHMRCDPSNKGLTLPELVDKYGEVWKQMGAEERKPYEDESKGLRVNRPVYTSQGRELSVELQERREAEHYEEYLKNLVVRVVFDDTVDVKNKSFFFVSFNVMVRTREMVYYPNEVGIVEYSISRGILNSFHEFIDPGDVPIGYARMAKEHSETSHKIPMSNFGQAIGNQRNEDGTRNMEARDAAMADLVLEIIQVLNGSKLKTKPDGDDDHFIVFCAANQMAQVKGCFKFICEQSKEFASTAERFTVLDVTRLLTVLATRVGKKRPYGICEGDLNRSTYNYSPNTNCAFHDEMDTYHCALGVAKRYCYMLSDVVCEMFGVTPTDKHFPPEAETNFEVRDVVGFSNADTKHRPHSHRYFNDERDEGNVRFNAVRSHNIRPPREFPCDPRGDSVAENPNGVVKEENPPSSYLMGIGRGRGIRVPQQKPNF